MELNATVQKMRTWHRSLATLHKSKIVLQQWSSSFSYQYRVLFATI